MKSKLTILYITLILTIATTTIQISVAQDSENSKEAYITITEINDIIIDSEGNYLIGGMSDLGPIVSKYLPNGTQLWQNYVNSTGENVIKQILLNPFTNAITLLGETDSDSFQTTAGAFQETFGGDYDNFLVTFNSDGTLQWSTYFGGSGWENALTLEYDNFGNLVITGNTNSEDFPLFNQFDSQNTNTVDGQTDLFILKLEGNGKPVFSTYLGGSGDENGGFEIMDDGSLIGMGRTSSGDFQTTVGAYQEKFGGGDRDLFVTRIGPDGQLLWSTYFGGEGSDSLSWFNWVLDNDENYVFSSATNSSNIDTTDNSVYRGGIDTLLAKFDKNGNLVFSTYFGGSNFDNTNHGLSMNLLVDSENSIILSAQTNSDDLFELNSIMENPFPDPEGLDSSYIVKYNENGEMIFATYFILPTDKISFQFDSNDNIIITGSVNTYNNDFLPEVNNQEIFNEINGGFDIFLTKLSKTGEIVFSTYFGGWATDIYRNSVIDNDNNIIVLGITKSSNFPITNDEDQEKLDAMTNRFFDLFLIKFDPQGNLLWSRIIGGDGNEEIAYRGNGLATNDMGDVIIAGRTSSTDMSSFQDEVKFKGEIGFVSQFQSNGEIDWIQYANQPPLVEVESNDEGISQLSPILLGSIIILGALGYGYKTLIWGKKSSGIFLNPKMESILSPVFANNPKLLYLFVSQTLIKDKDLNNEVKNEVPEELFDFKDLFHPVRMSMIKLLYDNTKMTTIELKEAIGIEWHEIHYNLKFLESRGYVETERAIVDGVIKTIVHADAATINQFQQLKEMLVDFLTSSPNMGKYLEHVLEIKNRSSHESDLYPNTTIDS